MKQSIVMAMLFSSCLFANTVTELLWEKNQSFYDYLLRNGINPAILTKLDDDTQGELKTILAQTPFFEHREAETDRLLHALIPIGEERQISLYEEGGGYKIELIAIRYQSVIETLTISIEHSLLIDLQKAMGNSRLAQEIMAIFDDRVDFSRDMRRGDQVSAVYIRKVRLGRTHGAITALSCFIETNKKRRYAFYNQSDEGYYDEKGQALAGMFLKYPVFFSKISSTYMPNGREHPVLGVIRPHLGVDFGAKKGASVFSVADGTARFVGCQRGCDEGYGKLVIIEHKNGWESRYAHLNGFARSVRQGARIRQGQTIGYVGNTGITTGVHLHFEMRKHARTTNPLAIKNVRQDGLKGAALERFIEEAKKQKTSLDYYADTASGGVTRLSSSAPVTAPSSN